MKSGIFNAPSGEPARTSDIEDGFVVSVSPREARRQFQVSLGLMVVMAAAFAALLTIYGLPARQDFAGNLAQRSVAVKTVVQQPAFVGFATAARAPTLQERRQPSAPRS